MSGCLGLMTRELAYLLLICGLLVVPGLLLRLRIPPPLTCFRPLVRCPSIY
jgi:hypothetical protein